MKTLRIFFSLICCISIVLIGCGSKSNSSPTNSSSNKTTADNNNRKAELLSKNFQPLKVLNGILYVPKKGFKQLQEPKIYPNGGVALFGSVEKEVDNPKELNLYNILVTFGKDESVKSMKPEEEETVLNNTFEAFWIGMKRNAKVATKHELLSKGIYTNTHGKKYLKFVHISGNPNRPKNDSLCKTAIYIFGDTAYFIDISAMKNFAQKHEDEFDVILDSFMVK